MRKDTKPLVEKFGDRDEAKNLLPRKTTPRRTPAPETPAASPAPERKGRATAAAKKAAEDTAKPVSQPQQPSPQPQNQAPETHVPATPEADDHGQEIETRPSVQTLDTQELTGRVLAAVDQPQDSAPIADRPRQVTLYPPVGKADAFRAKAKAMSLSQGALALYAVEANLQAIQQQFAGSALPQSALFGTFTPRTRTRRDREGITLYLQASHIKVLDALAKDIPGCRSRNDLLSTAVELLLSDS